MRALGLALLLLRAPAADAAQPPKPSLFYLLQADPAVDPGGLRVSGVLYSPLHGALDFAVLADYGSIRLPELVESPSFMDEARRALPVEPRGGGVWRVRNPAGGSIHFSYRLRARDGASPGAGLADNELPLLTPDFFFLYGSPSFLRPVSETFIPARLVLRLPPGWEPALPWPLEGGSFRPPSAEKLADNYLAGGRLGRLSGEAGEVSFELAWLGGTPVPAELAEALRPVFAAAVRLFGGPGAKRYLLIFKPLNAPGRMEATPKSDSIQFTIPRGVAPRDLLRWRSGSTPLLLQAVAHEYTHTWGRRSGETYEEGAGPSARKGGELRWLREGWTDYFADLILLRAGALSARGFVEELGRAAAELSRLSGYGRLSLLEASRGFLDAEEHRRFCYLAGSLLALELDLDLRSARAEPPRSLTGFMRRYLPAHPPDSVGDSLEGMLEQWERYAGEGEGRRLRLRLEAPFEAGFPGLARRLPDALPDLETRD